MGISLCGNYSKSGPAIVNIVQRSLISDGEAGPGISQGWAYPSLQGRTCWVGASSRDDSRAIRLSATALMDTATR